MQMQDIVDEIKLELTGQVLETEIEDETIIAVIKKELRELEHYWDETTFITVPFASCIDFNNSKLDLKEKVSSIVGVYRTEGIGDAPNTGGYSDPMYLQQWTIFSNGGTMYNLNDYILNYASYTEMTRIKNTLSTDLAFKEDRHNNKLYVNAAMSRPSEITIEYIPKLVSVEDIKSDYWIDKLIRLSVAMTKVILGRIRTRYVQSGALWTQDGETLLNEGNTELKELRDMLTANANMVYPID